MLNKQTDNKKEIKFVVELDALHAPDELVKRTLESVRLENESVVSRNVSSSQAERELELLHEEKNIIAAPLQKFTDPKQVRRTVKWRRLGSCLAAAACLVMVLDIGSRYFLEDSGEMGVLNAKALPEMSMMQRGDMAEENVAVFLQNNDIVLETLVPGYRLDSVDMKNSVNAQGRLCCMASAVYSAPRASLTVTVSDFETILYQAMDEMPAMRFDDNEVRFARGMDDGTTYAAWQQDDAYFTASTDQLESEDFVSLLETVLGG